MANIIGGIQGLLQGVNQGLSGFLSNRQLAMENEQKAKALALQEREAKRLEQANEFERRKAQYEALMGPVDPSMAQPFVESGFPLVKNPDGTLTRPLGAQEQYQLGQKGLTDQELEDRKRQQRGREILAANPNLDYEAQARIALAYGIPTREVPESLEFIGKKAEAEQAPIVAGQLRVEGARNAGDLARQKLANQGSLAVAQTNYNRFMDTQAAKPVDSKKYDDWKLKYFATNPDARKKYIDAVQQYGTAQAEAWLVEAYKQLFGSS